MRASLSLLRSLSFPLHHLPCSLPTFNPHRFSSVPFASSSSSSSAASHSNFVEHSASKDSSSVEEEWDYWGSREEGSLWFDLGVAGSEMIRHMGAPSLKVKELEELPEEWRRSKLTWLCKELPALACVQRSLFGIFRILDEERKWLRQEDATYVVVHFIRIGEYVAAHRFTKPDSSSHLSPHAVTPTGHTSTPLTTPSLHAFACEQLVDQTSPPAVVDQPASTGRRLLDFAPVWCV